MSGWVTRSRKLALYLMLLVGQLAMIERPCRGNADSTPAPGIARGSDDSISGLGTKQGGELLNPKIQPGQWELGVAGSYLRVEGTEEAQLALRGGRFFVSPAWPLSIELEVGYVQVGELDAVDLGLLVDLGRRLGTSAAYPHLGLGVGIRPETVGSFSTTRYPVGIDLGFRFLVSKGALVRIDYRYRRVMGDPVADFDEHRLMLGVSLLLGDGR